MGYLTVTPAAELSRQPHRRVHSPVFKAHLVALCQDPATSVAAIARAHNINDNMLHRWIREAQAKTPATPSFIALPASAEVVHPAQRNGTGHIQVTLQGKQINLNMQWPLHDAQGCATFICEVLR